LAVPAIAADASDMAGRAAGWQAAVNGRDELMANLAETRELGISRIELAVTEAASHGDTSWGRGTYSLMDAEGNVMQAGKWLNVSTRVDGAWLIHRDIWNTDTPDP
jgi:ketosteroid isomerase-like protein